MHRHLDSPNFDRQGFVYILSSPILRGVSHGGGGTDGSVPILKIGATRNHPIQRAREVSAATGVPIPYELAYYRSFLDCFDAETAMHERFADDRVNEGREFFSVALADAIAALDEVAVDMKADAGITGGTSASWVTSPARRPFRPISTPWADLFASFPDDGSPRELTPEEQAKCRALGAQ